MMTLENVSKRFVTRRVLQDCNLSIEKGKIIGVVGENGAGKTTLMKMMAGLLKQSSGDIKIFSQPVNRMSSENIAFATDGDYYFPYFRVRELRYYMKTQFSDFDAEKATDILKFMEIDSEEKIKYLSKGNLNRLKIAMTLSRTAPLILLDEPFSGLDPMVRKAILKSIIRFVDLKKQTLALSTHELAEVEPILDEVILVKNQTIFAHEPLDKLREKERLNLLGWMEQLHQKQRNP